MEEQYETQEDVFKKKRRSNKKRRVLRTIWRGTVRIFSAIGRGVSGIAAGGQGGALDSISENKSLYIGAIFTIWGLLHFESDRFCDGVPGEYIACTRPTTYYYYSDLTIVLIIIGVLLLLTWWLKHRA